MDSEIRKNGKGGSDLGVSERGLVLATNCWLGSVCRSGRALYFETKYNKRIKKIITRIWFCFISV